MPDTGIATSSEITSSPTAVYIVDKDGNPVTSDNPIIVKVSNTGDFPSSSSAVAPADSSQVVQYLDYCNSGLILCAVLLAILLGVSLMRFFFDRFRA